MSKNFTSSLNTILVRIVLFALAYAAVWTAAMTLLAVASAGLAVLGVGWVASLAVAALWHATPARQASLNRCHRLPRLGAFGWLADRDCLAYGFTSGLWCVGDAVKQYGNGGTQACAETAKIVTDAILAERAPVSQASRV